VSIPNPESWANDPAFPDIVDDASPERERLVEPQEPALPGDRYLGVDDQDTTVEGQIEGESLDQKLARETPDTITDPRDDLPHEAGGLVNELHDGSGAPEVEPLEYAEQPAGRLIQPDEGVHEDTEATSIADAALRGETDFSPEESAIHVREA